MMATNSNEAVTLEDGGGGVDEVQKKLEQHSTLSDSSLRNMRSVCDRLREHCNLLLQHRLEGGSNDDLRKILENGTDVLLDLKMAHRYIVNIYKCVCIYILYHIAFD